MEKVIIIGAGPAGLTAAIELLKNGGDYDVTILESSQAMGGISQTVRYNGNRMDIGGHRFSPKISRSWIGGQTLCLCRASLPMTIKS